MTRKVVHLKASGSLSSLDAEVYEALKFEADDVREVEEKRDGEGLRTSLPRICAVPRLDDEVSRSWAPGQLERNLEMLGCR